MSCSSELGWSGRSLVLAERGLLLLSRSLLVLLDLVRGVWSVLLERLLRVLGLHFLLHLLLVSLALTLGLALQLILLHVLLLLVKGLL
jgi:hypothetical protein